jgi:hypothetical protein
MGALAHQDITYHVQLCLRRPRHSSMPMTIRLSPHLALRFLKNLLMLGIFGLAATLIVPDGQSVDRGQDAAQYQLNLDVGVYSGDYEIGVNKYLFAVIVRRILQIEGVDNPFRIIGIATFTMYLFVGYLHRLSVARWILYLTLIAAPSISLNYTEIFRQGLAGSFALLALSTDRTRYVAVPSTIIAASLHQGYLLLLPLQYAVKRIKAFKAQADGVFPREVSHTKRMSRYWVALATAAAAVMMQQYFGSDNGILGVEQQLSFPSVQRALASALLLSTTYALWRTGPSEIVTIATAYMILDSIMVFILDDFTRLQTLVMPLTTLALLSRKLTRHSLFALANCSFVSVYIWLNSTR